MKKRKSISVVRKSRELMSVKRVNRKHLLRKRRPIHKRIMLHPATIFMLLVAGVLLAGWTFKAGAENITVTASILAPLPTSAAEITYPSNNTHVTTSTITVTGNCSNNTYVMLYKNGVFNGMANCGPSVTSFHILTDLSLGVNQFYTRVFNITNNEGPQSSTLNITYELTAGAIKPVATVKPLAINYPYEYKIYTSGKSADWNLYLSGGQSPYALTVDWGDGHTSTLLRSSSDSFIISHTYQLAKNLVWEDNIIRITAVDSKNTVTNLQLSALVTINGAQPISSNADIGNTGIYASVVKFIKSWIWLIWPAYAVVLLMTTSFWLGEREEYIKLKNRLKQRAPRVKKQYF